MNVLHILSPQPPGETGGADLHVADLVSAQLVAGPVRPHILELGKKGYPETLAAGGVPARAIADPYRTSVFREVASAIREVSADVVHTHGYDADLLGIGGWLRCPRPRPALVATMHGLIWRPSGNFVKTNANLAALRLAADAVIVTSRRRANRLRPVFPPSRLSVVANGVQIVPLPHRPASTQRTVLGYVGRLSREKGVHRVIEVCVALREHLPELTCRIVGTGAEESRLRELSQCLGVADRIQFVGLSVNVAEELSQFDVLLLLSDTEGTPRAVVEAMAARVPVVATAVGGIPELVRHEVDALLIKSGDVAAAAAATKRIVAESALAQRLVASSFQRYQTEFTVEHMCDAVQAVYERVMRRRSSLASGHE